MSFNSHKGTMGHSVAKSIMTPDLKQSDSPGHSTSSDPDSAGQSMVGFSHASIKSASNGGFSVSHTPTTGQGSQTSAGSIHPESPAEEQMHVFRNAQEAHQHLGTLLGLREGSGSQRD